MCPRGAAEGQRREPLAAVHSARWQGGRGGVLPGHRRGPGAEGKSEARPMEVAREPEQRMSGGEIVQ